MKGTPVTTFLTATQNQTTRTENGMLTRRSSANACVDLFYTIGTRPSDEIIPAFAQAHAEERELALRIAQWARDVRGGAGMRDTFRTILTYLEQVDVAGARALLPNIPVIGRWDDLLVLRGALKSAAFDLIAEGLAAGNQLCAKWMPRQGPVAIALRQHLGLSPKQYRQLLVGLTNVVEQQMCARRWHDIDFAAVPSQAALRYRTAFAARTPLYGIYLKQLAAGEAKINATAIYPHQVIRPLADHARTDADVTLVRAQWQALPNYIGAASVLPLVDVSGSMGVQIAPNIRAIDVAVALGLYMADKNVGAFKDLVLTFTAQPELLYLQGDIVAKYASLMDANWGMNTNLHAAFDRILEVAVANQVPAAEMPQTLLILSDMQFDECVEHDDSAIEMIVRKYTAAGYQVPQVVFWNLRDSHGIPARHDQRGVALVSGYSPSLMRGILELGTTATAEEVLRQTVVIPRYDLRG